MKGFSVIELIVAILVVGILSAVAFSRFMGADAYNPAIASAQALSSLRLAQQRVIGRADVSVTLRPDDGELQIAVSQGATVIHRSVAPVEGVNLSGDVNETGSCATVPGAHALDSGSPMVFDYDTLGNLVRGGVEGTAGYPVAVDTGARFCVNNDPRYSICISKTGYAYRGDCVD